MHKVIEKICQRLKTSQPSRIVAFGSSNTERYLPGMHWFDCLDLALRNQYGRVHTCINSGVSGDTTRDLLRRFNDDVAFYHPHLVIVTIGGNDTSPVNKLSADEFESNLLSIFAQLNALDCQVIFQTYYAPDPNQIAQARLTKFYYYMDIVRRVANNCDAGLIDHLVRWEPFRQQYPDKYQLLMLNGFHTTTMGNLVLGVDIARHFAIKLGDDGDPFWREALAIQQLMDNL